MKDEAIKTGLKTAAQAESNLYFLLPSIGTNLCFYFSHAERCDWQIDQIWTEVL